MTPSVINEETKDNIIQSSPIDNVTLPSLNSKNLQNLTVPYNLNGAFPNEVDFGKSVVGNLSINQTIRPSRGVFKAEQSLHYKIKPKKDSKTPLIKSFNMNQMSIKDLLEGKRDPSFFNSHSDKPAGQNMMNFPYNTFH